MMSIEASLPWVNRKASSVPLAVGSRILSEGPQAQPHRLFHNAVNSRQRERSQSRICPKILRAATEHWTEQ